MFIYIFKFQDIYYHTTFYYSSMRYSFYIETKKTVTVWRVCWDLVCHVVKCVCACVLMFWLSSICSSKVWAGLVRKVMVGHPFMERFKNKQLKSRCWDWTQREIKDEVYQKNSVIWSLSEWELHKSEEMLVYTANVEKVELYGPQ